MGYCPIIAYFFACAAEDDKETLEFFSEAKLYLVKGR